jgi:hypothetical protein
MGCGPLAVFMSLITDLSAAFFAARAGTELEEDEG